MLIAFTVIVDSWQEKEVNMQYNNIILENQDQVQILYINRPPGLKCSQQGHGRGDKVRSEGFCRQ